MNSCNRSLKPVGQRNIYAESACWLCENRKTRFKTRIQGSLAQILQQYPNDYKLTLLFMKDAHHEYITGTH